MEIFARQGDLIIERLDKPIEGDLVKKVNHVFAGDSSQHQHRIHGVILLTRDSSPQRSRFRVQEEVPLVHERADGHTTTPMPPGDYEIHPLRERGDASDRYVAD